MSHTLSAPPLRALLAFATVAVIGLAIAALVLASSTHRETTVGPSVTWSAQTADPGARLDHRGLNPVTWSAQTADLGAKLDHRGLRTGK